MLILSGLSCTVYPDSPISGHAWPTTEPEPRSFITPECPFVVESLRGIIGDPPYELTKEGFDAIRDWVACGIEYKSDQDRAGRSDDWQTPQETLKKPRVGDCEDFSVLLCSLLRAYGVGAEHVFVVIGVDGRDNGHVFLIENWYLGGDWRAIEPQAPAQSRRGFPLFRSADAELDRYEIIAAFNDVFYYDEDFPWGEDEVGSWSLADVANAVGNLTRRMSQLLAYVLGLLSNEDHQDEPLTAWNALAFQVRSDQTKEIVCDPSMPKGCQSLSDRSSTSFTVML